MCKFLLEIILLILSLQGSWAQSEEQCYYGPGSIAASVILTLIVTILLLCVFYLLWKRYWIKNREKNLVLETDPEKGKEDYAYDNAAFGETTSTPFQKVTEKNGKVHSSKSKWSQWSPLGVLATKNEKPKTLDDSVLQKGQIKIVSLKSHDFTGLGFNIYGNMRDGIFIKDILHRGPASESGKLNSGDRIKSVTINFEHVVYEDALTILSYASPYEVILEAQGGKMSTANQIPTKTVNLGHPLYRSASTTDLIQIQKTTRKRLFLPEDVSTASSPYSSLQKTQISNAPTLERNRSKSPQQDQKAQSPQQLKTQLEQKIFHNHKQQLRTKDDKPPPQENEPAPVVVQKTENKYQKFGIKVLPVNPNKSEQTSPKSAELSQNDNNINLERHFKVTSVTTDEVKAEDSGIDEVDKLGRKVAAVSAPPPIKKREKNINTDTVHTPTTEDEEPKSETFVRNSTNGSGIKRDKDGIPQEIPSHMLNAAVAARRNRKASVENLSASEDVKSPKKQKGRAPAPPDEKIKLNIDHIPTNSVSKSEQSESIPVDANKKDYTSDSDAETDNLSSVNTIELNASDITIHQTEDTEEMQNRRTASTGDLTKIQKTRKTSTGTLERAQSLDITDTTMPTLNKKRKGGSIEDNLDSKSGSDDSLYGNALVHKEPRLSLALDGLNTFQRSRLKKSTEWGNLEDAIVSLDKYEAADKPKEQTEEEVSVTPTTVNQVIFEKCKIDPRPNQNDTTTEDDSQLTSVSFLTLDSKNNSVETDLVVPPPIPLESPPTSISVQEVPSNYFIIFPNSMSASENFLDSERHDCATDPYYNLRNKIYDTNVSDDMKVSRHSLGSLETSDSFIHLNSSSNGNVSSITIGEGTAVDFLDTKRDHREENDELYTTALDATVTNENLTNNESSFGFEKVSVVSPSVSLTDTFPELNNTVTIEGPASLTLEIPGDGPRTSKDPNLQISNSTFRISTPPAKTIEESSPKPNFSLTYITEIQVSTPNTDSSSEPVENTNKNRFESNIMQFESNIQNANSLRNNDKVDLQKELDKIQEIAEEQLKKLPEMRFSTSSYEAPKSPENSSSQIDQLRSNFEKSPSKSPPKTDPASITKSRIPVATAKTPPTSPERRDSRNFDLEVDKEIVAIMSSPVHSTPISSGIKYQPKIATKNVSITSIRTNSKIPSGLPNRPPVPPRKYENNDSETNIRFSTNGNLDSSFKQWVFNPNDSANLTFTENKPEHK